jgi:hypothetical protein
MPLRMYRGRTQSLFRFLPGQVYNWQNRQGSFRGSSEVDTREMDVPRPWIKRSLRRLLAPFVDSARQVGIELPLLQVVEGERFELLEARKFRGEIYPRTYVCQECGRFIRSDANPAQVLCPRHGARTVQWSFVEFHRCGHLSELVPPQCVNRCRDGMILVNRESRSLGEWKWRCVRCGTVAGRGVFRGCSCGRGQVRVLRAEANPVFYAQYVTVVNPPSQGDYALLDVATVNPAAVAQALGAVPPGLEGLRQAVNNAGSGNAEDQARRDLVERFGLPMDDPMLEQMLQRWRERAGTRDDWMAAVLALDLDPESTTELGHQCLELTLARAASPVTIDDLIAQAPSPALRALYSVRYREVLEKYGFAEATLLREFPMAFVVAGYTREERNPTDGVLFQLFPAAGGTFPMYGQRTETEAILFRLDPAKVVSWLVASGIVDDPGNADPQAWLFRVMQPVTSVFEPPADRITAAVLGLVHTVAHRALKAVAVRSGLSSESLSEYLLPHNLAFLIYADNRSEFVLGGLEHVFRNYLADGLEEMDADRRCVFDPPCRNHTGACAFCMYLSETSCERFNSSLSRWYLFGGGEGGITWQGFWSR